MWVKGTYSSESEWSFRKIAAELEEKIALKSFIKENKRNRRLSWEDIKEVKRLKASFRTIRKAAKGVNLNKRKPHKKGCTPKIYQLDLVDLNLGREDPVLIPFWHEYCERFGWTKVVEDSVLGHQRFSTKCRKKNKSLDLNLIENIWRDIEAYLEKRYRRVASREELIRAVEEAWKTIPDGRFMDLCRGMPEWVKEIIKRKGYYTHY
ncbi:hypothetical protein L873DRAFT_1842857 [Choiromyces venosus 120613-1]|uniref:Tc1-like transposase DDE domain-containing protein n=1 Tax=Choiromyces venosus 120613-1 TaxID=1336337 RepID=A0A3N4JRH5_9PEZI|nr:hypothetical protein L873DRAFT_1842857 [Choiromyces venosus 120613-1]